MNLEFQPVSLDLLETYERYLAECPVKASDYTFANLWGWADVHGLEVAFDNGLAWIRRTVPEIRLRAPVGAWKGRDWNEDLAVFAPGTTFERVPEDLVGMWTKAGVAARIEESEGQWDYLYDTTELIELSGRKFHKKKNHLNQFFRKYEFTYVPIVPETAELALGLQADWCLWRDCEDEATLAAENRCIHRVLTNWDSLPGLVGGVLRVEGQIAAYTVGEPLDETTFLVHFEKGCPGFRGIYQAVNQQFLKHEAADYPLVNREQDLGDEGLRKAKMSYHPVDFLKKSIVVLGRES
ncbi:MAG: DUF2156 domain-containing protein [Desulfatibacillaceae bacterium]